MYNRRFRPAVVVSAVMAAAMLLTSSPLRAQERGWLGVELGCSQCSYEGSMDSAMWVFFTLPVITSVREDGPGARVGLLAGDTILEINGLVITSKEGSREFGAMKPGTPVTLLVRRGSRDLSVTVTPGTHHDVYGEWHALQGDAWDSLKVEVQTLSSQQMKLLAALRSAELALQRTEAMQASAEQEQLEAALRFEIDSIRERMAKAQWKLKLQADSLAKRTLWRPTPQPDVAVVLPPPEERALIRYRNAVAGARFEELDEDSELITYFPGVDGGLLVVKVVEGTPAYEAGLREGDVVFAVNDEKVSTVSELGRRLRAEPKADIWYVRKGEKKTCKISSK